MRTRGLVALTLCSMLVTLDGTAATVALPDLRRDLDAGFSTLQWITNASLLMLAALVIPAGALGDRRGRRRIMRFGLLVFAAGSVGCALAPAAAWVIGSRFVQGAGAALVVPGAIAIFRATYRDEVERTRAFGMLAAWTGIAALIGPVLGGGLVDAWSWRAVFLASAAISTAAAVLLASVPETRTSTPERLSVGGALLTIALLFSLSYVLIERAWTLASLPAALAMLGATAMVRSRQPGAPGGMAHVLARSPNCVAGNIVTAALYFGLFGISFLLALYTQAVLGYSATSAGISLFPIALMMLLCDRFARVASRRGSRLLITSGACSAGAGVLWLAAGPHPLPFWTVIVPGTALFGLGLSMAAGPLTHAAVSSLPSRYAGAASGVHHATVRAAGLIAIAGLGTLATGGGAHDALTLEGFRLAMVVCAAIVLLPGVIAGRWIEDEASGGLTRRAA